ncbi:MAG TPA: right-handed parallel beta-helix repeat-containing protein [Actinomycetota bacterium]|nr:right-handed parallel beta-helix repeat-containing protein [Actinomycetota bacterium]
MSQSRLAVVVLAAAIGGGTWAWARGGEMEIAPGDPIAGAARGTVQLLPGVHPGFAIDQPGVVVEALPGAIVRGPVEVLADGVALRGLDVVGGESGVVVAGAEDVVLDDVTVDRARLHGIEVVDASAQITGCRIAGLQSPYAQGIEIRNSSSRSPSLVDGCTVTGGREGLLTHSARVEFRGNRVTGTTQRAIAITEMSEGVMRGNTVAGVHGVGLYCGDMSHCEVVGNEVRDVASDGSGVRNQDGYAAVGWYYSTLRLAENVFDVPPDRRLRVGFGSTVTQRFPLSVWPPGWRGALPALWVAGLSLLGVGAIRAVAGWRLRGSGGSPAPLASPMALVLLGGLVVQTFHMTEHAVQVVQVYVLDSQHRSGLLGSLIDTEWVHFVYNLAVFGFIAGVWALGRPARRPALPRKAASWALAALVVQGYHLAEHTAKIVQHVASGIDPAPGLVGGELGLVWFHFGINLAVYVAMAIPVVALLRRRPAPRPVTPLPERVPAPA